MGTVPRNSGYAVKVQEGARRNGRAAMLRSWMLGWLALDGHVHYAGSDGEWCVTLTGLRLPLWVRVAKEAKR